MKSYAIILSGGSGSRMRGAVRDKCLENLDGIPVLAHSVRAFLEAGVVQGFVFVCRDDAQENDVRQIAASEIARHSGCQKNAAAPLELLFTRGGAERQDSVLNGLERCPPDSNVVFIHDAARPLITPERLRELDMQASLNRAAVLAHRVKDTIKRAEYQEFERVNHIPCAPAILTDLDRSTLWAMETPQAFNHTLILDAYRRVKADGIRITDDVAAATHVGHKVRLVENSNPNPKITEAADLAFVEFLLRKKRK